MTEYFNRSESVKGFRSRLKKDWPWSMEGYGKRGVTTWAEGADVGPGWYPLIYRLLTSLEGVCSPDELKTIVLQDIKEKWGHLSIYVSVSTSDEKKDELIYKLVEAIELASAEICDVCGGLGKPRMDGWRRTRCDKHETL